MYNVSSQFHTSVMSPSPPEKIRLTFADGTVLYNDYVKGFDYDEAVCEDTDLTVGSTIGAQLTIHIFKDEAEFQGFDFSGQYFAAALGVKIGDDFEYCPLGTFKAEKPETTRVTNLTLTAYDKMTLFDVPLDGFVDAVTFPKTAKQLFTALCTYVGVTASTADFINAGKVFTELSWPSGATCREFLFMIAELACSFARMSRDDACELVWFTPTGVELTKNKYSRRNAEYAVKRIDKLQVKVLDDDVGCIVGNGTNAYIIQDNPLLYGANDAAIRPYAQAIYDRLHAWVPIIPAEVNAKCDWSLQAGDIIKVGSYKQYGFITADGDILVTSDGDNFCVQGIDEYDGMIDVPIFSQHIHWNGGATVQYVSAGSPSRPVLSKENRREYANKRAYHKVTETVEEFSHEIYNPDGSSKIQQMAQSITLVVNDNEGLHTSITQLAESISLVVDSSGNVTPASIVASINAAGSTVKISADHVDIHGDLVTFSDLKDPNKATEIRGNYVKTGVISSANYVAGSAGMKLDLDNGLLDSKQFKIKANSAEFSGTLAAGVSITSPTITGGTIISGDISAKGNSAFKITGGEGTFFYGGATVGVISGDYDNSYSGNILRIAGSRIVFGSSGSEVGNFTANQANFYQKVYGQRGIFASDYLSVSSPGGVPDGATCVLHYHEGYYYVVLDTSTLATKENVRTIEYADEIQNLRPVLYKPKGKPMSNDFAGFIAEEVEKACPVLASYDENGALLGVQYNRVCAYLVAEAQQAKRERDELARKIVELEGKTS